MSDENTKTTTPEADLDERTAADSTEIDTREGIDKLTKDLTEEGLDSGVREIRKEMEASPREPAPRRGRGKHIFYGALAMIATSAVVAASLYSIKRDTREENMPEQVRKIDTYRTMKKELRVLSEKMGTCYDSDEVQTMLGIDHAVKKYRTMEPIFDAYESMGRKWNKVEDCSRFYAMSEKKLLLETSKAKEELCRVNLGKKDKALETCKSQNDQYKEQSETARNERDNYKSQLENCVTKAHPEATAPEAMAPAPMRRKRHKPMRRKVYRPTKPVYDSEPGVRDITSVTTPDPMAPSMAAPRTRPAKPYKGRL